MKFTKVVKFENSDLRQLEPIETSAGYWRAEIGNTLLCLKDDGSLIPIYEYENFNSLYEPITTLAINEKWLLARYTIDDYCDDKHLPYHITCVHNLATGEQREFDDYYRYHLSEDTIYSLIENDDGSYTLDTYDLRQPKSKNDDYETPTTSYTITCIDEPYCRIERITKYIFITSTSKTYVLDRQNPTQIKTILPIASINGEYLVYTKNKQAYITNLETLSCRVVDINGKIIRGITNDGRLVELEDLKSISSEKLISFKAHPYANNFLLRYSDYSNYVIWY